MAHNQPAYRPSYSAVPATADERRRVVRYMVGFFAIVALFAALGLLQLFQVSSEGPATDALVRSTAALTEIDALLDRQDEALRVRAEAAGAGETVLLDDYPIIIPLTPDEVLGQSREDLRALILARSGARLYEDGTGVLRETSEGQGTIGRFSVAGMVDRALGLLTETNHRRFGVASIVLLVVAAGLLAATCANCRGWGRAGAIGIVLAIAGLGVLLSGLAVMVYTGAAEGSADEYLRAELMAAFEDLAAVPVRNGAAALGAGLFIAAVAFLAGVLSREESETSALTSSQEARL